MAESNKPRGYLDRYGARLIDAGYEIIPIKRGDKRPPFDNWQKIRATKSTLKGWLEGGSKLSGVGILTRKTPGVDIDVRNEEMALKLELFVQSHFGFAPVRVGLPPKRLLLFRTDTPFNKVNSNVYIDPWSIDLDDKGKPISHKVEILGDGQQFVAYAVHPDTGKPYEWLAGDSPIKTVARDLPVLNEEDGRLIVAEFERLATEAGWELKKQGRALARPSRVGGGTIATDDVFASDTSRVEDVNEDEMHRKLLLVPGADDYETWLQIGMALFHQFDGEARGLELWHEWSATADNYDADICDAKWDTFDVREKGRAPVTARLILRLSKEAVERINNETFNETVEALKKTTDLAGLKAVADGCKVIEFDQLHRAQIVSLIQKQFKLITQTNLSITTAREMVRFENPVKDMPRWLENWVYISEHDVFYSTEGRSRMSPNAFNNAHGRFMLTKRDVLEGKSVPETSAVSFALNNMQIETVQLPMYLPGEDQFFWYGGVRCVNTYSERNVPAIPAKRTSADREAVEAAAGHLAHLFEDVRDRGILLDALAYVVQNPGQRLHWAILLQGQEGDGKSFFASLLKAVLGVENVKNLAAQTLEEKFNGWAEGCQVVFFEEIKLHGHNRFDVLNRVKPMITNATLSIRKMNTDVYDAINTATYILTTNYRDALPVDDNDSRYFPLFSRFQSKEALQAFMAKDPTYYDRLFASLEHPGALRKWLLDHRVSDDFHPKKRAPASVAKAEMISYSRSAEEEALQEILDESVDMSVCRILLDSSELGNLMADKGADTPYGGAMTKLLLKNGFTRLGKMFEDGKTRTYWSTEPSRFWTLNEKYEKALDTAKVRNWLNPKL